MEFALHCRADDLLHHQTIIYGTPIRTHPLVCGRVLHIILSGYGKVCKVRSSRPHDWTTSCREPQDDRAEFVVRFIGVVPAMYTFRWLVVVPRVLFGDITSW